MVPEPVASIWSKRRPTRWSDGSVTNLVADVGGLGRVDDADDLQLHAGRQPVEQPTATAEQNGNLAPGRRITSA